MIRETFILSGMGGGYEAMCQRMLWRGVRHLDTVKPSPEMWKKAKSYENVYGILMTEGEELKALEAAIIPPDDNDCTGAMHQCVMGHLAFIHRNGLEKWASELREARQGDPSMQFDDEEMRFVGFPPETKLSKSMEYKNT